MPAAGGILCVQNIAGTDEKMLTVACLEIERPAQRYDQLHRGRLVPGERAAGSRLLKGDRLHRGLAAQQIAALTGLEVYGAFLEMRVSVVSSPYPNASNHVSTPFTLPLSRRILRPGLPRGLGRPKGDDRLNDQLPQTDAARADRRAVPRACPRSPLRCRDCRLRCQS